MQRKDTVLPAPLKSGQSELETSMTPAERLVSDGLLTVARASQFYGLSRSSIYLLMEHGQLPYVKLGKARRIPLRALIELAARGLVHSNSVLASHKKVATDHRRTEGK